MNKRRRFKAHRRRRQVRRTMAILGVDRVNAESFLREAACVRGWKPLPRPPAPAPRSSRADVHAANRRMERMFPRSGVFGDSLLGGPRT